MTEKHESFDLFRRIGSTGLIIFERDGTLLRRKPRSRDLMLGDINEALVDILKQFRALDFCFGFVSDQRGKDSGSYGRSEAAALIEVLDELLRIDGAKPDFWVAWPFAQDGIELQDGRSAPVADMMMRALRWYGVDKKNTVFVSDSTSSSLAAANTDIRSIRYSGWRSNGRQRQHGSPGEVAEIQKLGAMIQRVLKQGYRKIG